MFFEKLRGLKHLQQNKFGVSYGIRTRVAAVRGQCPRPLDEGDRRVPLLT